MSLPGEIQAAISSVPGFDCDTALSVDLAGQFVAQGYKFCFRYLSRGQMPSEDLTEREAADILNSGLALMPVQHARKQAWSPNQGLGQQDGQEAAGNAETVGFPDSVSLWRDLERVNRSTQPQGVIDYCQAWDQAMRVVCATPGFNCVPGVLPDILQPE